MSDVDLDEMHPDDAKRLGAFYRGQGLVPKPKSAPQMVDSRAAYLTNDWMLVDVLDKKARDKGEKTEGGIIIPASVTFTGLRHCKVLMIGPGMMNELGEVLSPPFYAGHYILIAGDDLVAEISTKVMKLTGHFAMARSVVAFSDSPFL